ncbi:MAG TPA: carboxyl transferase domain-containing protein [Candidatus Angelobacter sp.]|nr:carboxyl transferase domain-containing protein [Candidatus Angelobacter sp.]
MHRLLIANRGEIAIRIMRAAAELGIETVAVFSEDDAPSLHTRKADEARAFRGRGAAAYLDLEQVLTVAREAGCDAIHPGYGFLSENAVFARRCAEENIVFVGPRPDMLSLFGDKAQARLHAQRCGVPLLRGTGAATGLEEAKAFFASLDPGGAMMIKAVAGGGGRGMRVVHQLSEIDEALARCRSEAQAAFGNGDVYVEELLPRARHIEVQIAGDVSGNVVHLWERECSVQRRHQKIVEIAPAPFLPGALRHRLIDSALKLAREVRYNNLGTFEFLIAHTEIGDEVGDGSAEGVDGSVRFAFIEANPRLQVEHTVTEQVLGVDLVRLQLQLASRETLAGLGLEQSQVPEPRGFAIQTRMNAESLQADGRAKPSGGKLEVFESPSGPGVRIDSCAYAGYVTNPNFDPLLAKLIVHSPLPDFSDAIARTYRALCEFRIEGVETNRGFLLNLLRHPDFSSGKIHTRFVEEHIADLVAAGEHRRLFFEPSNQPRGSAARAGAKVDASDPLAVLAYGKGERVHRDRPGQPGLSESGLSESASSTEAGISSRHAQPLQQGDVPQEIGVVAVPAPMQGTVVSVDVQVGDTARKGQQVAVMEAMKMEHVIQAHVSGIVTRVDVAKGDSVFEGHPLLFMKEADVDVEAAAESVAVDLDHVRADLAEVRSRHGAGLDEARPEAVARRRKTGQRTARENIAALCDPGTFMEYGPLVIAAQRGRRALDDLIHNTPADGLVAGIGTVNGSLFEESQSRCMILSYDYMVLAGTQGKQNHYKKDRMFEIAEKSRLPVVLFTEGGGGRPGDTDGLGVAGLDCLAFAYWGELSGLVPLVGVNSGRCFAGNAALLGCCDVVIATRNSNIGMGGPAMIEGGGLGIFRPEDVGPVEVQAANGVIDILVADEIEAVETAKKYLSYFQGSLGKWECVDQRLLRTAIPENRLRTYDMRTVLAMLADSNSVLELRRQFGPGMVTALIRVEGRPLGVIANNPLHLAGAIDSAGADKASRFMQLCDAFDLPILFLCDCPGIMVGPEAEKTALVRHASRMFVTGASLSVPFFTIILRKGYGLGAQAMAGGSFHAPFFTVAWPTGEFGGMGLEGAVKLGYRKELAAVEDPAARKALFDQMVARMYEHGKAVNMASYFEIDDVIDPSESRKWIMSALRSAPPLPLRTAKKRPCIDSW